MTAGEEAAFRRGVEAMREAAMKACAAQAQVEPSGLRERFACVRCADEIAEIVIVLEMEA
jgi:hypothetical protein